MREAVSEGRNDKHGGIETIMTSKEVSYTTRR